MRLRRQSAHGGCRAGRRRPASPMASRAAPTLDYEFFKARVEPIFLQKRDGHTRCYVCHAESNNGVPPGAASRPARAPGPRSSRAEELLEMAAYPGEPGRSRDQPAAAAAAGARGGRQCLPFLAAASFGPEGRDLELEDPGGLGQGARSYVNECCHAQAGRVRREGTNIYLFIREFLVLESIGWLVGWRFPILWLPPCCPSNRYWIIFWVGMINLGDGLRGKIWIFIPRIIRPKGTV